MKKKKELNLAKIVWIVGIFTILLIILFLVVEYKVKYENFNCIIKEESPNF